MSRRISVGERLAIDRMAEPWLGGEEESSGVDALFEPSGGSDCGDVDRSHVVVVITVVGNEAAHRIAERLVDSRRASMVNIVPKIRSVVRQGEGVHGVEESFLLARTRADLFGDILHIVEDIPSSVIPEVIALPIVKARSEHLDWISRQTDVLTDVEVTLGRTTVRGCFNRCEAAAAVLKALPLESRVSVWGKEVYFPVTAKVETANLQEVVRLGDICYWPAAKAVCIFLGPTPLSRGDEIRTLTPVEVIGSLEAPERLSYAVCEGSRIRITIALPLPA